MHFLTALPKWLFTSEPAPFSWKSPGRLAPRWLLLRTLGLIFFSAFYSLMQQVQGLIGTDGLLPVGGYLETIKQHAGAWRFWRAPTLFWFRSDSRTLLVLAWIGMIASLVLVLNFWPRGMIAVCLIAFLSFVVVLQTFSSSQSDSMLLSAGFISLFFAPRGFRPRLGERHPPSRASIFLLLLVWFTIYFESGLVKILGGDPEWREFTAMDDYYQNGPLPTWIAWYAHQLPHWFHVGTAVFMLALELVLVWLAVLPRSFRIVLFWLVTSVQIGIILTGNYAFLNYLVLAFGFLLLDDRYLARMLPIRLRPHSAAAAEESKSFARANSQTRTLHGSWLTARHVLGYARLALVAFSLTWIFYDINAQLAWMISPRLPLPAAPVSYLEPFRIANRYGPIAVITRGRYEIEFQGSNDGQSWTAYPFRYKPQNPRQAPSIFAPYQPRFDWNLWSASLETWRQNEFVTHVEERLLTGSPSVLSLFAGNPFPAAAPRRIRTVIWQYWFTDRAEKQQGFWWRRAFLGLYAPGLEREPDGRVVITEMNTIRSR
jgi:lipase maturation factor